MRLEVALHGLEGASHARLDVGCSVAHRVSPPSMRRPDRLADRDAADVVRLVDVEDDDGQVILHAQRDGRGVEHLRAGR